MKIIIALLLAFAFSQALLAQDEIQKDASILACNCIESISINSIPERDSIVNCFYSAIAQAINNKYYRKGKLKLSGKRFYLISGDLLIYLKENLYIECSAYKKLIDSTEMPLILIKDQ